MGEKMTSLLKRRRTGSMERDSQSPNKKQCAPVTLAALPGQPAVSNVATTSPQQPASAGAAISVPTETMGATPIEVPSEKKVQNRLDGVEALSALQKIIEQEFNMQILMKHRELRLIEQELAKCQIGLEQLRRCELKPYPGHDTMSLDISSGTGAAVKPDSGPVPPYAAPYGVTDGPYTRHYQHWLLQDPQFEPMQVEYVSSADAAGRATRNSGTARKPTSKSIGRGSDFGMPSYPAPAVKDKNLPQILRRSTDSQLVKLVCNNCHRWNFSSIQGFLNHCRIAHKVDYKSHDAAAIDCGQVLDEQELACLPQEAHNQPVSAAKPATRPAATPAPAVPAMRHVPPPPRQSPPVYIPPRNLVHPLNSSRDTPDVTTPKEEAVRQPVRPVTTSTAAASSSVSSTPLKQSPQVPRLSALFAKNGLGGDLEQAAFSARQRIDFGTLEDDAISPGASALSSPATPLPAPGARTLLGHGPSDANRPPSRKGFRQPLSGLQRHRPAPLSSTVAPADIVLHRTPPAEIPDSPPDSALNLSPNTATADSAPGLVSDDDDYDNGSASEDEAPHTATATMAPPLDVSRGGCGSTAMDLDIAVDHEGLDSDGPHHRHHPAGGDDHAVLIRRNDMMMDVGDESFRGTPGDNNSSRKLGKNGSRN
ncbi:hypothetical protein K431DRAFT_305081 [Polychaeton citri CBS 116435]|uniref:AHC1-like C2H2 zinc-finger domain-containing protein n=1 Tax=Polychaeton citri CBS 116435 TaxID=1314669 RepID=A0A9P4Q6T0_9PEZI|nr:hypothetical protein K431DRAFT_305081 [Polychaeton citri CBS 116435]